MLPGSDPYEWARGYLGYGPAEWQRLMAIDLGDYIDVATRITEFRAKYPDGYLRPLDLSTPYRIEQVGDRVFVVVVASAYRQPGDKDPGVGMAWEPFPGQTPYTKNSELMNAETSAWGRAIIAVGAADAKRGIASQEEVRNRQDDDGATRGSSWRPSANPSTRKADRSTGPMADDPWAGPPADTPQETAPGTSNAQQWRQIAIRLGERGLASREDKLAFVNEVIQQRDSSRKVESSKELSYTEAAEVLRVCAS